MFQWKRAWGKIDKMGIPTQSGGVKTAFRVGFVLAFVVLLSGILITGCSSQPGEIDASLGEEFALTIGQSASIAGEEMKIKFVDVVADSRCPANAICTWQGEVTCLVEITYLGSLYHKALTQPGSAGGHSQTEFGDYTITFNVQPYPLTDKGIEDSDYLLQLTIDRNPTLFGGVLATFDVVGEIYSVFTTNKDTIEKIFAVQRGESHATIPNGRLVEGSVFYNEPWSWHIDPEDIHMAEITIEGCDGTPAQIENNLDYWLQTVQRFCPWNAEIAKIEDFR